MASPEKVIGVVPGQPMESYSKTTGPADAGAETAKATSVNRVMPEGVKVAPWNMCGNPVPNKPAYPAGDYIYMGQNK